MTYLFWGVPAEVSSSWLSSKLHNQMIERSSISDTNACFESKWPILDFPVNLEEMKAIQAKYRDPEIRAI